MTTPTHMLSMLTFYSLLAKVYCHRVSFFLSTFETYYGAFILKVNTIYLIDIPTAYFDLDKY